MDTNTHARLKCMNSHPLTCLPMYCIILKLKDYLPAHSLTHSYFTWWHQPLTINFNDHQYNIIHPSIHAHTSAWQQAPQFLGAIIGCTLFIICCERQGTRVCVHLCMCVRVILIISAMFFFYPIQHWHFFFLFEAPPLKRSNSVKANIKL